MEVFSAYQLGLLRTLKQGDNLLISLIILAHLVLAKNDITF